MHDEEMLKRYVAAAVEVSPERPILIDKFLENAIEAEADAISDGRDAFVPAVMEHIGWPGSIPGIRLVSFRRSTYPGSTSR